MNSGFNAASSRPAVYVRAVVVVTLAIPFFAHAIDARPISHPSRVAIAQSTEELSGSDPKRADFGAHNPSEDARFVADRVAQTQDNGNAEFIIIDKPLARMYVFDARAQLRGVTPVLLGAAYGDFSVPGVGSKPLSQIKLAERTTPAGRFVAERGHDTGGADVVWVDYDAAVSIHRVINSSPAQRRLQRLATSTVADKRISWGCINVPVNFYESIIRPIFANQRAVVYVLPDSSPVREIFRF